MLIPLADTAFLATPVTKTSSIQKKPISSDDVRILMRNKFFNAICTYPVRTQFQNSYSVIVGTFVMYAHPAQ